MKYISYLTHNPQDFFDDTEAPELIETITFSDTNNESEIQDILDMVDEGYKAIIFPLGGDQ